jgi:CitMHS family citrate-Mg2+:H+ or citrate-Ca2+:H+ symporter
MGVGLAWTFLVAYVLGRGERRRLAAAYGDAWAKVLGEGAPQPREYPGPRSGRRGSLALNALVTLGLMAGLLTGALPLPVLFMVAFAVALVLNHPHPSDQKALLTKHAGNVIMVVVLVFASGIFTGILSGTKMVDEMATSLIRLIPAAFGEHFAVITALSSLVFTYFMANDPYYYGVLPVIAKTAAGYGVEPVQIARASILGMPMHAMSPLMAATYLLLGITGVEFSAHQRFVFRWAAGSSLVMIAAAVVFAAIDA